MAPCQKTTELHRIGDNNPLTKLTLRTSMDSP